MLELLSAEMLIAFLMAASCALLITVTRQWHGAYSFDSHSGVQKLHKEPTPRIGGIAVFAALVTVGPMLPEEVEGLWWILVLSGLPALCAGLVEDITKQVGVGVRLAATILSGGLFVLASGYGVTSLGIGWLDPIMGTMAVSLIFTAIAVGGIANAINIIDGCHGLASGTMIIILAAIAGAAISVGDTTIATMAMLVLAAIAGFFVVNFPLGRIFLGDAGAYYAGFVVAILAVMLPERNDAISPWVSLLALGYPVTETMVSILRRIRRKGTHPGAPDRLHLHSLVYRHMARRLARRIGIPSARNALTSVILWAFPALCLIGVLVSVGRPVGLTMLVLGGVVGLYALLYRKVALLRLPNGTYAPAAQYDAEADEEPESETIDRASDAPKGTALPDRTAL